MAKNVNWLFLSIFLTACTVSLNAQPGEPDDHDGHDQENHSEHLHSWEFGGGLGAVYNIQEEHFAPGLHLHLIRNLGESKRFGTGLGFETVIDEHKHFNFGIPVTYNTNKRFIFAVTPGVLFKKEVDWEASPSIHFETLYEFVFEHFHMGPMFEVAYAPDDVHLMLGIHVGL